MRKIPTLAGVWNKALERIIRRAGRVSWVEDHWLGHRYSRSAKEASEKQDSGVGQGQRKAQVQRSHLSF
jgi:hypothetical protein